MFASNALFEVFSFVFNAQVQHILDFNFSWRQENLLSETSEDSCRESIHRWQNHAGSRKATRDQQIKISNGRIFTEEYMLVENSMQFIGEIILPHTLGKKMDQRNG